MRILCLCLLLLSSWVAAEVYKTVDKDGRTVYTDKPKTDNAEKVELRGLNTVPSATPEPDYYPRVSRETPEQINYNIEIISPRNDVAIPVGQRDLAIAITLSPALQPDHLLVYFMNGELLEETTMNNIIVKDVPRGTHTLVVEAIDQRGQSLGTSAPTLVNVIRANIKKNAPIKPTPK
jgi:hypothetical protein